MPSQPGPPPSSGPSFGLVLVRVATGALLFAAGWEKVQSGAGSTLVAQTAERWSAAPEPLAWWGANVVTKLPQAFGHLGVWAELVVGLLLFLGLLTRPAGFLGAFLFVNAAVIVPGELRPFALLIAVCCFACGLSRAGHSAGADVFVSGRLPAWLTWTRG